MSGFAPRRMTSELISASLTSLEFDVALVAPMTRVFAALTEATLLMRWFCDRAESEARAGGRIVLGWNQDGDRSFVGHWTIFAPFHACGYGGGHTGSFDGYVGHVEFALEPGGEGTSLAVQHTFPGGAGYEAIATKYRSAWPRALARLETLLALPSQPEFRP